MATSNGIATIQPNAGAIMEDVIAKGDLGKLTPEQRAAYYLRTCESMGLNPLTKPFDYITLNGKLTLYAMRTATDQLRQARGVSITRIEAETSPDGLRIVTAYARDAAGREDSDLGVVNVKGLGGDNLANAYMKALTKAKRRVTLSICGLGWMDESELETVPSARPVNVDVTTGEIIEPDVPPTHVEPPQDAPKRTRGTSANVMPSEPVIDWTVFWNDMRARGIDAQAYEALVGRKAASFSSPQEAIDALRQVEDEIAAEQPQMFDMADPDRHTR